MSSLTVLSWSLWLLLLMSSASALGHKATRNPNQLTCGVGPINYNRILNGLNALPGQYPFMVNLRYKGLDGNHLCGGVIIDETHILTARHCLLPEKINVNKMEVFIGDHDQRVVGDGERKILIEPPILHEMVAKEKDDDWWNDIALIRTIEPMRFYLDYVRGNGSVNQICVPSMKSGYPLGLRTKAAGWGYIGIPNNDFTAATQLQQLPMELVECPDVDSKMICARSVYPKSALQRGDSGSPLFWQSPQGQAYLIGLDSVGIGDTGVVKFVDVSRHLDWINENW